MTNTSLTRTIIISIVTSVFCSGIVVGLLMLRTAPASPAPTTAAGSGQTVQLNPVFTGSDDQETKIVNTIRASEPAVVSVIISKNLPVLEQYFDNGPSSDFNPFGFNFQVPRVRQNGTRLQEIGGGTAFFVSADGLLMTNKHVVSDAQAQYTVLLNDGRKLDAKVVATDPGSDIALLKVDGSGFTPLVFSTADAQLGQTAIAIGNALAEFRNTVSVGVISGLQRSITAGSNATGDAEHIDSILQTDAAINEGNSGGPLLSSRGDVIGMNTAVASNAQNIGFAIPATELQRALDIYKKNGKIVRPFLGIRYTPITADLQKANSLAYDYGMLVSRGQQPTELAVIPGSPADKAGIQENDIILYADGKKLTPDLSLAGIVKSKASGDSLDLKISHRGQERDVKVVLEEQK